MRRYHWARTGDVNAFFGLMLDNVAVMVTLFVLLTRPVGGLGFTPEFVLGRMIPGTAIGVLLGDLVYTWMAFRLARRSGRDDVTAMPLGLDTPSTFGISLLVLLPALAEGQVRFGDHDRAMEFAWHVGVLTLVLAGVFKVVCAPLGNLVRRLVPRAGLLGSLAAIALALIAFLPMLLEGIAAVPLVGLLSLAVILLTLVAHRELPWRVPGALAAVLLGVGVYFLGELLRRWFGWPLVPEWRPGTYPPWQPPGLWPFATGDGAWWAEVLRFALGKLPVALPFALATVVGGIDCTESAAAAGDDYDTRAILLTEGVASLLAGCLGGVLQTTPYIGHPAYKKMGGAAAYTLATALFIGVAGYFGWFTRLFDYLPTAAMFPILVFVGLEITAQTFHATPGRHYPAVALAMLPALAYLALVVVNNTFPGMVPPSASGRTVLQTLRCLANGFLVCGMLWAAALAVMLDGRLVASALYFLLAGLCALFGIIHSPLPSEQIGLPWNILSREVPAAFREAVQVQTPYHWAAAYGLVALLLLGLARWPAEHGEAASREKAG
jgi:AGZA family xanthine/uracil permease-like MFS transporter